MPEGTDYRLIPMGKPRQDFLPLLAELRQEMNLAFTGFSDMDIEQLQACTGLSEQACVRAQQRDFTEPLLWEDTETALQQFTEALGQHELQVIRGGRFVWNSWGNPLKSLPLATATMTCKCWPWQNTLS